MDKEFKEMTLIKQKECGCFGKGHSSKCEYYAEPDKSFVARFVGTQAGKIVWNAAIDEAAIACDKAMECIAAARIRELKK